MTDIAEPCGWIPPSDRTDYQLAFDDAFAYENQTFADVSEGDVDLPERALFPDIEREANNGELLCRYWQLSGSCVACGAAMCYAQAAVGDVIARGDVEAIKPSFPFAPYGVGRQLGGMRGPGEGSFGSTQAKASKPDEFGILPYDHQSLPEPTLVKDGKYCSWLKWTKEIEILWSWPPNWPISEKELKVDSSQYGLHKVTRLKSIHELKQSLAQAFGVSIASNFGTQTPTPEDDGVLLGRWTTNWGHQMSVSGYMTHRKHGLIFAIQNQWGPAAHGTCPTLGPLGVRGAFWMLESDMAKILSRNDGEVFAHSSTGGFPTQRIDWSTIFRYE